VPFPPVTFNGHTFLPSQANNFYIFPAVGMAIYATRARRVTDVMFIEAARAVADQVLETQRQQGLLYPLQSNILETEIKTAARVPRLAFDAGHAQVDRPAMRRSSSAPMSTSRIIAPSPDRLPPDRLPPPGRRGLPLPPVP